MKMGKKASMIGGVRSPGTASLVSKKPMLNPSTAANTFANHPKVSTRSAPIRTATARGQIVKY